jgi:hypothetical protein
MAAINRAQISDLDDIMITHRYKSLETSPNDSGNAWVGFILVDWIPIKSSVCVWNTSSNGTKMAAESKHLHLSMKEGSLLGPAPHRDRDYCIRSNFWKFYLIRTGFTLGESVSLVKVFRLFKLEQILFWCLECEHSR